MKAFVCSVLVVSSICAAGAQSLRAEIEKYNRAVSAAMMKKDMAAMAKLMHAATTPDFKYIENGKAMSVDKMIDVMGMGLGAFKKITLCTSRLVSLKEQGKTATATAEYKLGGTLVGKDKKPHVMISTGTSVDTYVKVGGKWKESKMVWGAEKMTLDGRPMSTSQMMGDK